MALTVERWTLNKIEASFAGFARSGTNRQLHGSSRRRLHLIAAAAGLSGSYGDIAKTRCSIMPQRASGALGIAFARQDGQLPDVLGHDNHPPPTIALSIEVIGSATLSD